MALYKVVLNGDFLGQDIKNILYYRNGLGFDISGLTAGGTLEVAQCVKNIVWPTMKPLLPVAYQLQDISAYVYNDQTFDLLYQNPTTVGVGDFGTDTDELNGGAPCAIIRFALEPHIILVNGPKPPKRGYMAFGPLTQGFIDTDGSILYPGQTKLQWDLLCAALANNVAAVLPIPCDFFPVRVHMEEIGIAGKLKITSFSDVRDCTVRDGTSFRRSRMAEA